MFSEKLMYYGMDGQPIPQQEAWPLVEDSDGRRVDLTELPSGVWISTVLLVIDHNFGSGDDQRPIIFESMVFPEKNSFSELDMRRYHTKEEAEAGHQELVTKWTGWSPGDPYPEEEADYGT